MMSDVFDHMPQQVFHNGSVIFPVQPYQRHMHVLLSDTHSPSIHTCTVNLNWWVLNCKACYPAQTSISHRYLILPFIRKSSKRLDVGKISYFAQFSILPLGIKFNFPPKVCSEKEKKINIHFLSRGGSVTHLKEVDGGGWEGRLIGVPSSLSSLLATTKCESLITEWPSFLRIPRMLHKRW